MFVTIVLLLGSSPDPAFASTDPDGSVLKYRHPDKRGWVDVHILEGGDVLLLDTAGSVHLLPIAGEPRVESGARYVEIDEAVAAPFPGFILADGRVCTLMGGARCRNSDGRWRRVRDEFLANTAGIERRSVTGYSLAGLDGHRWWFALAGGGWARALPFVDDLLLLDRGRVRWAIAGAPTGLLVWTGVQAMTIDEQGRLWLVTDSEVASVPFTPEGDSESDTVYAVQRRIESDLPMDLLFPPVRRRARQKLRPHLHIVIGAWVDRSIISGGGSGTPATSSSVAIRIELRLQAIPRPPPEPSLSHEDLQAAALLMREYGDALQAAVMPSDHDLERTLRLCRADESVAQLDMRTLVLHDVALISDILPMPSAWILNRAGSNHARASANQQMERTP